MNVRRAVKFVIACLVMVAAAWFATGCTTPPSPPTRFAQCMEVVAAEAIYQNDRLRAAEWCVENFK